MEGGWGSQARDGRPFAQGHGVLINSVDFILHVVGNLCEDRDHWLVLGVFSAMPPGALLPSSQPTGFYERQR